MRLDQRSVPRFLLREALEIVPAGSDGCHSAPATLCSAPLVHQAFLRLVDQENVTWASNFLSRARPWGIPSTTGCALDAASPQILWLPWGIHPNRAIGRLSERRTELGGMPSRGERSDRTVRNAGRTRDSSYLRGIGDARFSANARVKRSDYGQARDTLREGD